jgi:Leucine-rich repeat (LRR) protein
MRWVLTASGLVVTILAGCSRDGEKKPTPPAGQQEVVAAITKIGGTVAHEQGDPNKPVTEVNLKQNFKVSEDVLSQVKKLGHLQKLDLTGSSVTDAELAHLKDLASLQSLWLSKTQVTDDGLSHLKGLKNLTWLDLNDTKITDTGLTHLTGLTGLRHLEIQKSKVTAEGADKLKAALPNLSIVR